MTQPGLDPLRCTCPVLCNSVQDATGVSFLKKDDRKIACYEIRKAPAAIDEADICDQQRYRIRALQVYGKSARR